MSKLTQLIEDIFLGLTVGGLLLFASSQAKAEVPSVHPLPITRPAPKPTYPEPRVGGTRQFTPTYPEPRVGIELRVTGHNYSLGLHARF